MKESTKKMLMYGAIILIVVVIGYFAFFRNKDAEHKKQTTDNVKSTLEKSKAAKEMAKDKDPVTQAKVDQKVEQAVATAVTAESMKHDNPEQAKEVAKAADQQATAAVAAAAQIPMAPPMAPPIKPSGVNTGMGMAQFDKTGQMAPVIDALKAELARRGGPKGEAFRYYYRRRQILDNAKAFLTKYKDKLSMALPLLNKLLKNSANIDLCSYLGDEGEEKLYDFIINKGPNFIQMLKSKISDIFGSFGDTILDQVPDDETIIGVLVGILGDQIEKAKKSSTGLKLLKSKLFCKSTPSEYFRYDWGGTWGEQ
jgi:hypothetical protein